MNLRQQAQEAIYVTWFARSPDSSARRKEQVEAFADAASDVWEPVVDDLVLAVALYSGRIESWDLTDKQKDAVTRACKMVDERLKQ